MRWLIFLFCWPLALFGEKETVVLLHGLAATSGTMGHIERTLEAEGYRVVNIDYPSMSQSLDELAVHVRADIVRETADAKRIDFVTHSMGGILLRMIERDNPLPEIGRVVMISPPNQGSMAVNLLADMPGAKLLIGPAGMALASGENEQLQSLKPATFEVGVIAGSLGLDPFMSSLIPGADDGVISVESTKLEGMTDFTIVHETHPMLVFNGEVMDQTTAFLKTGKFLPQVEQVEDDNPWMRNWTHRQ
ncbi:esterase/lipase family protein [Cerasicoccus arenae]|uniref:Acetyltransferase n=1 Tax=Cerasicoccus arenae TaxID=424488 RepID=A0A8J3GD39_9BACT|nr:alpha/beta fold hydrolase [Cerasicoccus arenae]MBK1858702.1 alpha/beta fold hydrolase [Cerasicoccus arenae]GHB98401.1 acetyltransferase [Cerasicoccus arenae]